MFGLGRYRDRCCPSSSIQVFFCFDLIETFHESEHLCFCISKFPADLDTFEKTFTSVILESLLRVFRTIIQTKELYCFLLSQDLRNRPSVRKEDNMLTIISIHFYTLIS